MNTIKRFRIFNADEQFLLGKYHTTEECYNALKKVDIESCTYIIECVADDITVSADDFISAWEHGERPLDLQPF